MTSLADPGDTRLRVETTNDENDAWIIIHGEADMANLEHLEAALASIELDGARTVHIHLADLDFFDVAALRQLIAFARQLRRSGREVTTCGAPPMLRKVTRILNFEDDLGLS